MNVELFNFHAAGASMHSGFGGVGVDLPEWILLNQHNVSDLLHYVDDFISVGPPQSPQCAYNLSTALAVCKRLGLPLHPNKRVGPTKCLSVLGIEPDSVLQVA